MRLHPIPAIILVAAMLLAGGCAPSKMFAKRGSKAPAATGSASVNTPPPAPAKEKTAEPATPEAPAKADAPATVEQAVATTETPVEPAGESSDPPPETPEGESTPAPASTPPSDNPSASPPEGLDAGTLMMMNEHLEPLPPEERERLYQEWKSLDALTVRERIREREASSVVPGGSASISNEPAEAGMTAFPPVGAETLGGAPSNAPVTPADFSLADARGASGDEAEMSRPVPLLDDLAAAQPEAPPAERRSHASATDWDQQLKTLIPIAEARAEATHRILREGSSAPAPAQDAMRRDYIASQIDLRLLYLMAGERGRALQSIANLEPEEQEFWRQVLWAMAAYFDAEAMPDRTARATQTIQKLRTAINKLQGEARLQLQNVTFCRKITSFGNFERFEEEAYGPGQRILLYAELINFKSVPRDSDGLFKTQLKSTIEILRENQSQPLQRIEFEPTVDLCRSYRQDYFHSYELKLPFDLEPGPHVLKLTVEDVQSDDVAVYSLNFTVK